MSLLVEESNNYYKKILISKYGYDYKNIILLKNSLSSYESLFIIKGITKNDILIFIGIRIFMGLHKYPNLDCYWNSNFYIKLILILYFLKIIIA